MPDPNKQNLLYFESHSMKSLYEDVEAWQEKNGKRLLSANIQKEGERFCCVALTNPMEVALCSADGSDEALVIGGRLWVNNR